MHSRKTQKTLPRTIGIIKTETPVSENEETLKTSSGTPKPPCVNHNNFQLCDVVTIDDTQKNYGSIRRRRE